MKPNRKMAPHEYRKIIEHQGVLMSNANVLDRLISQMKEAEKLLLDG